MKRWSALSSAASNFRCQTCALAVTQEETSWTRRQHRGERRNRPALLARLPPVAAAESSHTILNFSSMIFWRGCESLPSYFSRLPENKWIVAGDAHALKSWSDPPEKWLSPTDFRGLRKNLGLSQNSNFFGNFGKWPHFCTCLAPWPWQWLLGMWKAKNIHFQQLHA